MKFTKQKHKPHQSFASSKSLSFKLHRWNELVAAARCGAKVQFVQSVTCGGKAGQGLHSSLRSQLLTSMPLCWVLPVLHVFNLLLSFFFPHLVAFSMATLPESSSISAAMYSVAADTATARHLETCTSIILRNGCFICEKQSSAIDTTAKWQRQRSGNCRCTPRVSRREVKVVS
jgi:hypothetical protein